MLKLIDFKNLGAQCVKSDKLRPLFKIILIILDTKVIFPPIFYLHFNSVQHKSDESNVEDFNFASVSVFS